MMLEQRFDLDKAIQVLLFITQRVNDLYAALKVMYFADMDHIEKYGRLICGDHYIAMEHGPVPSGMYDIVKFVRGDRFYKVDALVKDMLRVDGGRTIVPLVDPNKDYLSESDIECLEFAIKEYGNKSFSELKRLSHLKAGYPVENENDEISLEQLVVNIPGREQVLEYLTCD